MYIQTVDSVCATDLQTPAYPDHPGYRVEMLPVYEHVPKRCSRLIRRMLRPFAAMLSERYKRKTYARQQDKEDL